MSRLREVGHVDVRVSAREGHNLYPYLLTASLPLWCGAGQSAPLRKAPAWMRRPAGARFGFGGKLVSFANHKTQTTDESGQVRAVPCVSP